MGRPSALADARQRGTMNAPHARGIWALATITALMLAGCGGESAATGADTAATDTMATDTAATDTGAQQQLRRQLI